MQAARLHGRAIPTASARLATASEAGGAPGSRGLASAVRVDEGSSDSAGQVISNTRFFRAVEKLDNGVAIIRCVVVVMRRDSARPRTEARLRPASDLTRVYKWSWTQGVLQFARRRVRTKGIDSLLVP